MWPVPKEVLSWRKKGVKIQTCEHILAALVGMNLDNVIMELDAPEPPIMDGSAKYFVEAIEKVGIVAQEAERHEYIVHEVISYKMRRQVLRSPLSLPMSTK